MFHSARQGPGDLYRKAGGGGGSEDLLYADSLYKEPLSWSLDGKFLLYEADDPKTKTDLWILPDPAGTLATRKPLPFLQTPFNELHGQFSPNGRWIAYQSNQSGRQEIYIRPFRGREGIPGEERQIAFAGGVLPRWRRDGKELFYVGADRRLMAVDVTATGDAMVVKEARPFGPVTLVQNWTATVRQ